MAEKKHAASPPRRRWLWVVVIAAFVAGVVIAVLLGLNGPSKDTDTATIHGVEYTTNVPIDEHNGYVYVYIPVNAEVDDVIVEVENSDDNAEIREFLDTLDTFVPGEHIVELSNANLHFIVDGMEEE